MTISKTIIVNCLAILGLAASCATFESDRRSAGVVIERNKLTRPVWVDSPTNKLLVNANSTRFHYSLLKQRDLAIAVKLSQTNAISESFNPWHAEFERRLSDFPQLKALRSSPRTSKDTETLLQQAAHQIHSDVAQIEDIYYERVRIDDYKGVPELRGVSEYFDVHTLLNVAPYDTDKLRAALATSLMASKISEIKKVGREISLTARKNP